MITHCRLPFRFDQTALLEDLGRLESRHSWIKHFVPENYDGNWSALPLNALAGNERDIQTQGPEGVAFTPTRLLRDSPYLQQVLDTFRCPLASVRLMRLGAGSRIKQHVDAGGGYEHGELRLHVPITTNPGVAFMLDGTRVDMQAGECWYLNVALPHSVVNDGPTARVHLVIDCTLNDWLDGIFAGQGFSTLEKYGTKARLLDDNIRGLRSLGTPEAERALTVLLAQRAEIDAATRERSRRRRHTP